MPSESYYTCEYLMKSLRTLEEYLKECKESKDRKDDKDPS